MRRTLTLCALSCVLTAGWGCGDDDGGDATPDQDAGKSDSGALDAAVSGAVRIENVGASCTSSTDCRGANATCLTSLGDGNLQFELPGGYCTATCSMHAECSTGGGCPLGEIARTQGIDVSDIVQVPSVCLDRCKTNEANTCRSGYVCRSLRDLVPENIRNMIGFILIGPNFTDTFCIPPVEITLPGGDAGVPDGGLTRVGADGMDAGR